MASPALAAIPFLFLFLLPTSSAGEVICEKLRQDLCAFAISSSSRRCVLEREVRRDASPEFHCTTSDVVVDGFADLIETNKCVTACGLDRNMVGISSDAFLEPGFISKLCSARCYQNCPNIVDLYFNLAAGEGVLLSDVCHAVSLNPKLTMADFLSYGAAAGPTASFPTAPSPTSEFLLP